MVSGYIYHGRRLNLPDRRFQIDVNEIKAFTGKVKEVSGLQELQKPGDILEWCIISAVNKLLVVTDENWKIKETRFLNSKYI